VRGSTRWNGIRTVYFPAIAKMPLYTGSAPNRGRKRVGSGPDFDPDLGVIKHGAVEVHLIEIADGQHPNILG
jgi:hypothetical protein